MSHYETTKARIFQWIGIVLVLAVFAGAYWYFQVYGSTVNAPQNDSLTSGLVGLWSFNGDDISGTTAYDRSGSGNNGTLTNGPTVTQGKVGQALNFTPDNSYVTVAENDTLDLQSSLAGTFSAWIYNNGDIASYQNIVEKGYSSPVPYQMYLVDNSLNLGFYSSVSGSVDSGYAISTGKWIHTTVTVIGTTTKFYVDGVLVATKTGQIGGNGVTALIIGSFNVVSDFNGSIDEVRVYNRALSATEIQSLYALGQSDKANSSVSQPQGTGRLDSGLAGYWKLDENTGTSAGDASTNGNTGTLTNGPTWTTGQIGSAVDFDGTNDYITNPSFSWPTNSPVTVAFWNYTGGGAGNRSAFTVGNQLSTSTNIFQAHIPHSDNILYFDYGTNSTGRISTSYSNYLNRWTHVVLVNNGTNFKAIYLDGVLVNSGTSVATPPTAQTGIWIGAWPATSSYHDGKMDDFRVYNRALSADEVSQLYRVTAPTGTDTGLKGYWSFNGKDISGTAAYDRSGVGNNGTLTNGPAITEGKLGQALRFDGTNDYVSLADSSDLRMAQNESMTFSAWIKLEATGAVQNIIRYDDNDSVDGDQIGSRNLYLFRVNSSNAVEAYYGPSASLSSVASTTTLSARQWYHVVFVRDVAADTENIYIQGVLDKSETDTTTGTWETTGQYPLLGRYETSELLNGVLDEVRIYNRALSAAEIQSLYATGQSDKVNSSVSQPQGTGRLDSGLAGYWKLDENTGTSAGDSSTNGNTGTLTNGPTWTTGQIGSAVDFDGTDDYISTGFSMNSLSAITVSAWVKRRASNSLVYSASTNAGPNDFFQPFGFYTDGRLYVSPNATNGFLDVASNSTNWVHVVYRFDGSQSTSATRNRVWLDGVEQTMTGSLTTTVTSSAAGTFNIGRRVAYSTYTNGAIDEVRVYNRALSVDEISQLHRLTSPTGTDTGLKGYWSFNGKDLSGTTAYDRSGSGKNGTLVSGPTVTEGKLGQALRFDGSNDYVSILSSTVSVAGPVSISMWAKKGASTARRAITIRNNSQSVMIAVNGDSGKFFHCVGNNGSSFVRAAATDGIWYHIVCIVNGATLVGGYLNGIAMTAEGVPWTAPSSDIFNIGSRDGSGYFDGSIDEVRVYNRALSATEIAALYNASR